MLLEDDFFSLSRLAAVWVVSDIIINDQSRRGKRKRKEIESIGNDIIQDMKRMNREMEKNLR
jgi:BMFP domain-containing protein YqiC